MNSLAPSEKYVARPPTVGHWLSESTPPDLDRRQRFYEMCLPVLRATARQHGYALGLHGSMRRDLDLIAMPWVKTFSVPGELAKNLQIAASGSWGAWKIQMKPHGRIGYTLFIGTGAYIDLSVMIVHPVFF